MLAGLRACSFALLSIKLGIIVETMTKSYQKLLAACWPGPQAAFLCPAVVISQLYLCMTERGVQLLVGCPLSLPTSGPCPTVTRSTVCFCMHGVTRNTSIRPFYSTRSSVIFQTRARPELRFTCPRNSRARAITKHHLTRRKSRAKYICSPLMHALSCILISPLFFD